MEQEQSQVEHASQDASVVEASQLFQPDQTASEVSFMPGQAAVMSTPAATSRHQSLQDTYLAQDEPTHSWSASLESPLVRLDRDLQSLTQDDEVSVASSSVLQHETQYDDSQDVTERQIQLPAFEPSSRSNVSFAANDKGKGKETADSLRHNVLRRGIDTSLHAMRNPSMVSPLKVKGKTPVSKSMNPYLSPGTKPSEWKGVVDLKDPSVATPRGKTPRGKTRFAAPASTKRSATPGPDPDLDLDDDLDATLGMSPPVMMAFAKLPKTAATTTTPKLGRTPRKQAAERIMKSLLDVEKRLGAPSGAQPPAKYGGPIFSKPGGVRTTESSLTSAPTPPSLSRYSRNPYPPASEISGSIADASLESMMRRVGLNVTGTDYRPGRATKEDVSSISSSVPSVPSGNAYARPSLNQAAYSSASTALQEQEPVRKAPSPPMFDMRHLVDDELVDPNANDDSSDSLDYEDPDASEAFLVAQQGMQFNDNSFSSGGSSDMDDDEGGVHPFVHGMAIVDDDGDAFDDEDSYDDPRYNAESTEEETLFGVPPAQRLAREAQNRLSEANLRMLGQEQLEDTIGIGAQRARAGVVDETPTPWPR